MAKLSIVDTVKWIATIIQLLGYGMTGINLVPWNIYMRPLQKGIFLPPALFANAHLLLNKLRFAAELKNKNLRFLHAVSSYAKLSMRPLHNSQVL